MFYVCFKDINNTSTIINYLGGPRLVESLTPKIVTTVGRYFDLRCLAETEEMLDIAYVWTHNGMKIRDIDIKNMNYRMVRDFSNIFM